MTPFSCEECRAELASLTYDASPSAHPATAASATAASATTASATAISGELSSEAAAHLQSCDKCQIEYSMLRGIVGELRALPSFAAPSDLRARIRDQIARETANETAAQVAVAATTVSTSATSASSASSATTSTQTAPRATPRHSVPRRSLFPRFFVPRWATYSLSGALATAFLLFVARDINPDFAPRRESRDTSSSAQQDVPSQAAPAVTRVAPAQKGKTPSATNNRATGKNALNSGILPKGATAQKVAPVAPSSASGAPSSTRAETTAPATTARDTNGSAGDAPATKNFERPALNQTKNGAGNSLFSDGSTQNPAVPKVAVPKIVVPKPATRAESSAPRLLPSAPRDLTPTAQRDRTIGTPSNPGVSKAGAPISSTGSAAAPKKNDGASAAADKRFARLELLPPSSLKKAPPMRIKNGSVRRQVLSRNAPALSKSSRNGDGMLNGGALSADASSADAMEARAGNANASGAPSSAPSSTRSGATSAARLNRNADQRAGDATSEQPAEHLSRSRASSKSGQAAYADTAESSASTKAPSTLQDADATASSASAAAAPTAPAMARGNTPRRDAETGTALKNAESGSFSMAPDATATPLENPLLPAMPRGFGHRKSASTLSANGLNQRNLAYQTRQNARLVVMPRQNAKRARVLVTWISDSARTKTASSVVWQGAARRNQEIVVSLATPRGNKNRRVQVSLQGANARGEWQTLDTIVIDATPIAR